MQVAAKAASAAKKAAIAARRKPLSIAEQAPTAPFTLNLQPVHPQNGPSPLAYRCAPQAPLDRRTGALPYPCTQNSKLMAPRTDRTSGVESSVTASHAAKGVRVWHLKKCWLLEKLAHRYWPIAERRKPLSIAEQAPSRTRSL